MCLDLSAGYTICTTPGQLSQIPCHDILDPFPQSMTTAGNIRTRPVRGQIASTEGWGLDLGLLSLSRLEASVFAPVFALFSPSLLCPSSLVCLCVSLQAWLPFPAPRVTLHSPWQSNQHLLADTPIYHQAITILKPWICIHSSPNYQLTLLNPPTIHHHYLFNHCI